MTTVDPYVITVTVTSASQAKAKKLKSGQYTLNGNYHYSFSPDVAFITQANTPMLYVLDTTLSVNIVGFYSTDAKNQLGDPVIASDGQSVTVTNANSLPYMMFAFILVAPQSSQEVLYLDPSIISRGNH